jgi:hypothetical protein
MRHTIHDDKRENSDDNLKSALRALGKADPGPDFTDRVMARIESRAKDTGPDARIKRLARWLLAPRVIHISPLGTLATAAGLLIVMSLAFRTGTVDTIATPQGLSPVTFVLTAPSAREVAVIGSFNGWNAAGWSMQRDKATGVWTLSAALPPGSHEYVFLVDKATPLPDAAAPFSADDGFGSRNSILMVKSSDDSIL